MNNDKLICIRDEDDTKLTTLLSEGWRIIQISAIRYLLLSTLKENPITLKRKLKAFSDGEIYFNYSGGYYDNNNTRFRLHIF